ncbi:MAG: OmpA family protein [Bacteroidota bacterium]
MRSLTLAFLFFYATAQSQNLVPNPGFEEAANTINGFTDDDVEFTNQLEYWTTPNTASPDLITPDFYEKYVQPPAPRSGFNAVGMQSHGLWGECIGVALAEPLVPHKTYYVEYWIRRATCTNPQLDEDRAMNKNFGLLFSIGTLKKTTHEQMPYGAPQISGDSTVLLSDQRWTKIATYFTPKRKYDHLYLGQFRLPREEPQVMIGYYVIDDLLVEAVTNAEALNEGVALPLGSIIPLSNVNFLSGTTTLRDTNAHQQLGHLADYLQQNPALRIRINGHTDSVGGKRSNLRLSNERAMAIAQYIIKAGIREQRIEWKGFGEEQPIANNDTAAGRSQNRRVEFEVIAQ